MKLFAVVMLTAILIGNSVGFALYIDGYAHFLNPGMLCVINVLALMLVPVMLRLDKKPNSIVPSCAPMLPTKASNSMDESPTCSPEAVRNPSMEDIKAAILRFLNAVTKVEAQYANILSEEISPLDTTSVSYHVTLLNESGKPRVYYPGGATMTVVLDNGVTITGVTNV